MPRSCSWQRATAAALVLAGASLACGGQASGPVSSSTSSASPVQGPAATVPPPVSSATAPSAAAPTLFALNQDLGTAVLHTSGLAPGSRWSGLQFGSIGDELGALPRAQAEEFESPVFQPPVRWSGGWVTSWQTTEEHDGRWLALVSTDGETWYAVWAPGPPVPGGDGLIVYVDAAHAYTSSDGVSWTPRDVTGLDGWVAGAGSGASCPLGLLRVSASSLAVNEVHFSSDGFRWVRSRLPVADGAGVSRVEVACSAARLVALGWETAADGASTPAAFWSTDGVTWQRGATPAGPAYGPVLAARDGFIAFERWDRWLWSADGSSWTQVDSFGPLGRTIAALGLDQPHANGDRFLVRARDGRMWTSFDGRTWVALSGLAPMEAPSDAPRDFFALWPRGVVYEDWRLDSHPITYGTSR